MEPPCQRLNMKSRVTVVMLMGHFAIAVEVEGSMLTNKIRWCTLPRLDKEVLIYSSGMFAPTFAAWSEAPGRAVVAVQRRGAMRRNFID